MTDPIKAKIQELCPDVMELKFGCRFKFPNNGKVGVFLNDKEWKRAKFLVDLPLLPPHYDEFPWKDLEDVEILGSPITLAVVLRAIQEGAKYPNLVEYWLGEKGVLIIKNDDTKSVIWNLEKDYDQQSEECKQFIRKILNV